MKTPAPPPDSEKLMSALTQESSSGRLFEVLMHQQASGAGSEYLPWDKLRYKTPPTGLTHEEWWLAVKLGRRSVARVIESLHDVEGRAFTYALPDEVLRGVDMVNSKASGSITVSDQVTNPATRDRYVVSSLIEEAITSSQLEGASTSRRVAKEMIRTGRDPKDRSEKMILNNYLAMRRVAEIARAGSELTPDLICEIHRIVTDGTLDSPEAAGVIQTVQAERVSVWGDGDQLLHRPPPVDELPARIVALCDFANGTSGPYMPRVLRAITVHFMMGYDHYFEDGNGRTARAVFYWCMLSQGYWLTEFLTISKILKEAPSQYAGSFILTEQDDNDLTYFFIYQLRVILRAIEELHTFLARKAEELRDLKSSFRAMPGEFNYRQLALLEHAVRNPGAFYTAQSHATSHDTSNETARQDLMGLEQRGLLVKSKLHRRFVWTPRPDLSSQLRGEADRD